VPLKAAAGTLSRNLRLELQGFYDSIQKSQSKTILRQLADPATKITGLTKIDRWRA
jgi:hypothetical protein